MKKVSPIKLAILAMLAVIAAPITGSARSTILITPGEQAQGGQVSSGVLQELIRLPIEARGSGKIGVIHVNLNGATGVVDTLIVVSEEDITKVVLDPKTKKRVAVHSVREKVVGTSNRLADYYSSTTGEELPQPRSKEVAVQIDNDLVQPAGASKSYVVYALIGYNTWKFQDDYIQGELAYLETDSNTDISWLDGARSYGNIFTINDNGQTPSVYVYPMQTVSATPAVVGKSVTLGAVSVSVSQWSAQVQNPEFELWANDLDPKLFAGLVAIMVVDENGDILPGTKPVKPQFKLEDGHVKVVLSGITLGFEAGWTTLKLVGTFSTVNKVLPPQMTMTFNPQKMKWTDSFGSRILPNWGMQVPTVVCPPIRFDKLTLNRG